MENHALDIIDMLYNMIAEAWGVPLGNDKCIVERDKVLNLLDEIKAQLPTELAEAKRLVSARDEFINSARANADTIRKTAEDRAKELVEEQEIVRASKLRSNEILTAAESRTRELYRVANSYVDDALRRTEEAINSALSEVKQSRANFRSAAGNMKSTAPSSAQVERVSEQDFAD